jgi:hypothetical protein
MHIYVHVYEYLHMHIYIYICKYTFLRKHINTYQYSAHYPSMKRFTRIQMTCNIQNIINMHIQIYIYIYTCTYICIFTYAYIYIYIAYIHIHIYINIHKCKYISVYKLNTTLCSGFPESKWQAIFRTFFCHKISGLFPE